MATFEEFAAVRFKEIQSELDRVRATRSTLPCMHCLKQTLAGGEGAGAKCLFCGYETDGEIAAAFWTLEFGDSLRLNGQTVESEEWCPPCGEYAAVHIRRYRPDPEFPEYYCFACGMGGEFSRCTTCLHLFLAQEGQTICEECLPPRNGNN